MTRSHHRLVPLVGLVSQSIKEELARRAVDGGESVDHLIRQALADFLRVDYATLFQVSTATAAARVEGLATGEMTVGVLRTHGDHGVGTIDGLNGEMVIVDGEAFQIRGDGSVARAEDAALTPFALVTRFRAEIERSMDECRRYGQLQQQLDEWRSSDRHFYAIRVEGRFERIIVRGVQPATEGLPPTEAGPNQDELRASNISGVLAGFWSPAFVTAVGVPGYHLHFLDASRRTGGHLVEVKGSNLKVSLQRLDDFRVCLPETAAYLAADLRLGPATEHPRDG
ncbi:MAG: acetolactate decarboxylase [Rhodospirillales bacterium]